jgi:CBS domain-containing membrane protein
MIAADVMTRRVIAVSPEASVHDAIDMLRRHHLHDLPVTDADGHPVGIVTARAIVHAAIPAYVDEYLIDAITGGPDIPSVYEHLKAIADAPVATIMDRQATVVKEATSASAVAAILGLYGREPHNILVVDGQGCLSGVVSALDIVACLPEQG